MPVLFPFQEHCVDKLGLVSITARLIGDDMGLGKTYEGAAIDQRLRGTRVTPLQKTLIIAPRGVHEAWRDVVKEFMPEAKVFIINRKDRRPFVLAATSGGYTHYICHYEAMRLMPELKKVRFFHVLLDETHRIKNRKTQQTRAIKKLVTRYKTSMSGTAADDKPEDLWSTLNFLYPARYSSYWRFVNEVCEVAVEEASNGAKYHKIQGVKVDPVTGEKDRRVLERFHTDIDPFYVRRTKEEVLEDLPDKYYSQVLVDLLPKQRKIYDQLRKDMLAWIGQHEDEPLSAPVVIAQLIRLQQAALAMLEWHETGRMIPIRDPYIPDVTKLRPETKIRLIEPSVKLDTLFELIKDEGLCQRNHHGSVNPLVQFSQSKSFTKLVTRRMTAEGLRVAEFTGDTPDGIRGDLIKDFQNGQYDVFAATIATGGEGITLTRSSTMTFTDRTWNPSKNRQAEDREHRIGQPNAVHIIDIMARDTVDYRVRDTNIDKWASLRALLGDTSRGKRNRGS